MADTLLEFEWVDVFTDRPYAGNPLAVFTRPGRLTTDQMQTIARELNLSETTFVEPPELAEADFKVRIFTPLRELPMAGHPTLGTAHVLATQGEIGRQGEVSRVLFEEGVGPISIEIAWEAGAPGRISMSQPAPTFGRVLDERSDIARMLGVDEADLADLPIQVVSTGPPFLFVPMSGLAAAGAATLSLEVWRQLVAGTDAEAVYVFSLETSDDAVDAHGRLFAPGYGIVEDPATGSAVGPLGAYLFEHGILGERAAARIVVEQGVEMGRPSRLEVELRRDPGSALSVRVGGRSASVGTGSLAAPRAG